MSGHLGGDVVLIGGSGGREGAIARARLEPEGDGTADTTGAHLAIDGGRSAVLPGHPQEVSR